MVREKWMILEKSQGKVREKSGNFRWDILYEPWDGRLLET